jgi:hypothetical protein
MRDIFTFLLIDLKIQINLTSIILFQKLLTALLNKIILMNFAITFGAFITIKFQEILIVQ